MLTTHETVTRSEDAVFSIARAADEELLLRYRETGQQEYFSQLVRRYERELYNYLCKYLGNADMAEDVFQATFVQLHLKCEQFQEGRRFRPWLYAVATNQAIDFQRRNRRHRILSLDGGGLDYVVIDTEHNYRSRGELGDFLIMMNTSGVVPIVRIPIPDSHYVTMAMDAGAHGVLAPYCETVEQVREVVAAAKWRPLKGDAVARVVATGEHVSDATRSYLEDRNKNSIAIIGIESQTAVDNLDSMLEVPGIDGIFVGPNDMSISLGIPDQYDQKVYQDTVKSVIDKSEAKGIATLVHQQTPDLSTFWISQGARFVLHGTDRRALQEGFKSDFGALREFADNH